MRQRTSLSAPFHSLANAILLFTDLDLVCELSAGCAEVLFSSGSADAVGGHHTQQPTFLFLPVSSIHQRARLYGRVPVNVRTREEYNGLA
jgi:hypothetical protein